MTNAPRAVTLAVGVGRIVVGVAVVVVLAHAYALSAAAGRPSPLDYFGYFTNLTSLLMSAVFIAAGVFSIRDRPHPQWLLIARAVGATYLLLIALVYNLLVPGTGTAPPWVSAVLHGVIPVLGVLDWAAGPDRRPISWALLWTVLPYPAVWTIVVLIRGVTDGWVPYGFLLPSHSALTLGAHVLGLLVALLALGAAVWSLGRRRP